MLALCATLPGDSSRPGVSMKRMLMPFTLPSTTCTCADVAGHDSDPGPRGAISTALATRRPGAAALVCSAQGMQADQRHAPRQERPPAGPESFSTCLVEAPKASVAQVW